MAAPNFVGVGATTGTTDAGGAWTHTFNLGVSAGEFIILHVLQDGTTDGAVTVDSVTNAEDLAGTDNVLTYVGAFDVGASQEAIQHLWVGRCLSNSQPVVTGSNSSTDDIYVRGHLLENVSTGTTLETVIENGTAGSTGTPTTGTSATAASPAVTTLGPDRLAVAFMAINDDNTPAAAFSGQSGGTWSSWTTFALSTGTDGSICRCSAPMASAGTITTGGTCSIVDSDAWGVVGFALIGTTAAPPANPPDNTILKTYPQLLAH